MRKLELTENEFNYLYSKVLEDNSYIKSNERTLNDIDPLFKSLVTKILNKMKKVC